MGVFRLTQVRAGRKIGMRVAQNDHTNDGVRRQMSACMGAVLSISNWDIGFIDDSGYSSIAITDTATSHPGWTEASQARTNWTKTIDITETLNPLPIETNPVVQVIITADASLRGIFVTSRGALPEVLMAMALFDAVLSVKENDILEITYETAFQTPWP